MLTSIFEPRACEAVLQRIDTLSASSPGHWGRMNAGQAICHLADAFEFALGRRAVTVEGRPPLPPTILKLVALTLPIPWPKGVPTMPEADQERDGTPPKEFEADRERLKALIREFSSQGAGSTALHPFFGPMSRSQWGRWAWRHCDHHLRQFGA